MHGKWNPHGTVTAAVVAAMKASNVFTQYLVAKLLLRPPLLLPMQVRVLSVRLEAAEGRATTAERDAASAKDMLTKATDEAGAVQRHARELAARLTAAEEDAEVGAYACGHPLGQESGKRAKCWLQVSSSKAYWWQLRTLIPHTPKPPQQGHATEHRMLSPLHPHWDTHAGHT